MKTLHRGHRRAAGFTLIELLVVLAVGGIVLALLLPNFYNMIQRMKLQGAAQQTATLLRLARLEAVKRAAITAVQIDTAAGTVTAFVDSNNNQVMDSGETLLGQTRISKGVQFDTVEGFTTPPTPAVAVFRSNGGVALVGAFRFIGARGDQLRARVLTATSGRVQIEKLESGSWIANGQGAWKWK
jgi:type IV fimbrial biogenesis protein FimT